MNERTVTQLLEDVAADEKGNDLEKTIHKHFMSSCSLLFHRTDRSFSNESDEVLTALQTEVQKYVKAEGARGTFLDALGRSTVRLLWKMGWDAKLVKKLIKLISCLETGYSDVIVEELKSFMWSWQKQNLDLSTISKWSALLVSCESCRRLVSEKLVEFLGSNGVQGKLRELMNLQNPTVSEQTLAQMLIKVNLQCFQLLQNVADASWWDPNTNRHSSQQNEHPDAMAEILQCLLTIMKTQVLENECTLLSGTAVAFFLSLNLNLQLRAKCIVNILSWIRKNESQVICRSLVLEADDSLSDTTLAEIAFLSGILACAKEDILCEKLQSDSSCLALWLFTNINRLCYDVHQYQAFLLMQQWYNKVCSSSSNSECGALFCSSVSQVVKETMSLVWTNLDSPVEGVNQIIINIFSILIKCLNSASEEMSSAVGNSVENVVTSAGDCIAVGDPCQHLVKDVLSQIAHMTWHVKGKHKIAAAVLPLVPLEHFFQMNPDLFLRLLECMGTNYLSPCATDLLKAIIQTIVLQNQHAEDVERMFLKFCTSPFLLGLTNSNSLIRQNVNMFWLPWTLKTLPSAYKLLLENIDKIPSSQDDEGLNLQAFISLYKCARNQQLVANVPLDKLYEALSHPDDKLRMDGFSLICITNKKSEPLVPWELEALEKFLPLNMNMDNAPFRHQLQGCLRKLLVRARDSCLAYLRSMQSHKEDIPVDQLPAGLLPTLQFVQAVWDISIYSLHLTTSFQRLKSSLDWINVILDTFTYQPGRHQKKGTTPAAVGHLLSFANKFELLNFFNEESSYILLACIFHGTDEIREMAADLLLRYFPWPLPMATEETSIASITQTGLELSLSPKPYQSEAGALIMKLIFCKYVKDNDYCLTMNSDNRAVEISKHKDGREASLHYISQLTSLLGKCLLSAKDNILAAAQTKPAHGIVQGLRRCLSECDIQIPQTESWRALFAKLRSLLVGLLDMCLYVLGGRLHGEDTAPSFEQMGVSIQAAVLESLAGQPQKDDPVMSANYQIIATWCWVNIKEISMLFCHLVDVAIECPTETVVMDYQDIEEIGNLYYRVLTQCRHRGAIEGCNAGFTKYCSQLLFSSVKELTSIPRMLLNKVIDQVKGCNSAASITRRSAGLPLIVQSIVTAESKTKQTSLLKYAVETLIEVIASPVEEHLDENKDLPQVHALNVLQAVFRESSVSISNMQHLGTAAVATILCFSSSHWAVRNGAIQLYETLLQRMLGQKRTKDDSLITQTVQEFFTHFPNMEEFVMEQMRQAGVQHKQPGLQLHPSLFPIFTILTKLSAGPQQLSESLKELKAVVASLRNSPILAVREMSAQAILPLVPKEEVVQVIKEIVIDIPASPKHCSFNDIHGSLLHMTKLLQSQQESQLSEEVKDAFVERMWLMQSEKNPCALVRLTYIRTAMLLFDKLGLPLNHEITKCLENETSHILGVSSNSKTVQPGMDQYLRFLVDWWLTNSPAKDLTDRVGCFLQHKDVDVKLSALSFLSQKVSNRVDWREIMENLIEMVCKDSLPFKVLCGALKLIMSIYEAHSIYLTISKRNLLWPCLMKFITREVNSYSSALSVGLSAVLAKEYLQDDTSWGQMESWTELLSECSSPLKADVVRQQTAVALTIVSPHVSMSCGNWKVEKKKLIYWNIYTSTCKLLMDENIDIREQAARVQLFISDEGHKSLHPNLALEILVRGFILESLTFDQLFILKKTLGNMADLNAAIKDDSNKLVDDLFEPEDVNPYQEDLVVMQLELDNLKSCGSLSKCEEVSDQIRNCVVALQDALPVLEKDCADPLNITCQKATFKCLWQCFNTIHMSTLYRPPSHICDEVKDVTKAYSELRYLHPVLKRKLNQISST